jgi:hypothetical protein
VFAGFRPFLLLTFWSLVLTLSGRDRLVIRFLTSLVIYYLVFILAFSLLVDFSLSFLSTLDSHPWCLSCRDFSGFVTASFFY